MSGSLSGVPDSPQPPPPAPSKTKAACALPSRTRRSLYARLPSGLLLLSAQAGWNHVHQQPPHTPLCFSHSLTKAPQVSAPSGLIVYSLMTFPREEPSDRL